MMISDRVLLNSHCDRKFGRWHTRLCPDNTDGNLGITSINHWCDTETCIFQLNFPFTTNACLFFCTVYLSFFNLSQKGASKKSVLGNMQPARRLKAAQASHFSLLVSGCLDPVFFFHTLVVSVQVKSSGLSYNWLDSGSPFYNRASLPSEGCTHRNTFFGPSPTEGL